MRAVYPIATTVDGGYKVWRYRVLMLRVTGNAAPVEVGSFDLTADSGEGSVLGAGVIDTDRVDLPSGSSTNVALVYWYEGDRIQDGGSADFGNMKVKGCLLRDFDTTTCQTKLSLSVDSDGGVAVERTWSGTGVPSDYGPTNGFFYDPNESSSQKLKFLVHWQESPGMTFNGAGDPVFGSVVWTWHANIVKADP